MEHDRGAVSLMVLGYILFDASAGFGSKLMTHLLSLLSDLLDNLVLDTIRTSYRPGFGVRDGSRNRRWSNTRNPNKGRPSK
jgi:hypothetical protein